jgi:hypothetical protein
MVCFSESRRVSRAGSIALVIGALLGCGEKPGMPVSGVNGRVISAASRQPLADAQVLIEWHARVDAFASRPLVVIRACKTRSAVDGTFSAPAWRARSQAMDAVQARVFVFLPGYNTRPIDTPVEHPGAETVDHPMFALRGGEIAASDELIFEKLDDCTAAPIPHS